MGRRKQKTKIAKYLEAYRKHPETPEEIKAAEATATATATALLVRGWSHPLGRKTRGRR